jgi:molecular chaperone GrpE (heat shock protein)
MSASKANQEDLDHRSAHPAGAAEEEGSDAGGRDVAALEAENAALRDRLLRGLADAENTLRCAERSR